jgi:hypothetical protein
MSQWIIKDVAKSVPFDNATNGFISSDTQAAIEEVANSVLTSASPGFSFGRSGNVSRGAYLLNESVPSNISGRYVYINNAEVKRVFISTQISGTYKFGIYWHEGDEVNITKLGDITITSAKGATFSVNWAVTTGKQLAVRVEADSTDQPKEVVAGLELAGTR